MLITFWQRRLLIQQVEAALGTNGTTLLNGEVVKINKLSIPQLREVLAWVNEHPTMDSWLLACKEKTWSERAKSAINKLNK